MNWNDNLAGPRTTKDEPFRCKTVTRSKLRLANVTTVPQAIAYPHLYLLSGSVTLFMNLWPILIKFQPFHGKRTTSESAKVNLSEEALAYERARQQNAREETSRLKGKAKDVSTGSTSLAYERACQQNAREETSRLKGKAKDVSTSSTSLAYERARQQNAHEVPSRLKGKAKNFSTGSTSFPSEPPAYTPTMPSSTATTDDAANARALQAQLDSERASYELARQLQAQEEATLQEHRRLVQEASRVRLFHCYICIEELSMDYAAPITSCGHVICRTCMKEHVQSQVDQSIWPIRCPLCVADHARTKEHGGEYEPASLDSAEDLPVILSVITRDLIETLGVDEAVLVKWVKLEMEKVSVAVECRR